MERTEILERIWTAKEEKRRRGDLAQGHIVLPWGVGHDLARGFVPQARGGASSRGIPAVPGWKRGYGQLSRLVGVTPRGIHVIMRNPIWTGWRVIDKKNATPRPRVAMPALTVGRPTGER